MQLISLLLGLTLVCSSDQSTSDAGAASRGTRAKEIVSVVNLKPDSENKLPKTRDEKQQKIFEYRRTIFDRYDENHDGMLSFEEYYASVWGYFLMWDANGDGKIDLPEYLEEMLGPLAEPGNPWAKQPQMIAGMTDQFYRMAQTDHHFIQKADLLTEAKREFAGYHTAIPGLLSRAEYNAGMGLQ